jgi:putative phage-type endonuclease
MIEQGTEEWFLSRLGKVTASRVADVMAKTKSGYGAARKNYMMELLCQRLTGAREEGFTSAAMQRGTELEPMARGRYEIENDVLVMESPLVDHDTISNFAASPDGLVNKDGLIEIKCPNTAQHVEFIRTGKIDRRYQIQMLTQMLCTDRKWCDFVSFDDRLPKDLQYKCQRFDFDATSAGEILTEVSKFLAELDALVVELQEQAA